MSAGAKVPGTVAYYCDESGVVNEPYSDGLRECQRQRHILEPLISRAEAVAFVRHYAASFYISEDRLIRNAVERLADALERGEEGR